MNEHDEHQGHAGDQNEALVCPDCERTAVRTIHEDHSFKYGCGPAPVELNVTVPARRCDECGFSFYDAETERIKHEAVCRHLGVLTPSEVMAIRGSISRAEFAALTGLGEATIGRWERGALVQSRANDLLLRLLQDPRNVQAARPIARNRGIPPARLHDQRFASKEIRRRQREEPGKLMQEKRTFRLRAA